MIETKSVDCVVLNSSLLSGFFIAFSVKWLSDLCGFEWLLFLLIHNLVYHFVKQFWMVSFIACSWLLHSVKWHNILMSVWCWMCCIQLLLSLKWQKFWWICGVECVAYVLYPICQLPTWDKFWWLWFWMTSFFLISFSSFLFLFKCSYFNLYNNLRQILMIVVLKGFKKN